MVIPTGKSEGQFYRTYFYSDGTRIVYDKQSEEPIVRWFPDYQQWIPRKGKNPFDNPNDDALLELMRITSVEPITPSIDDQLHELRLWMTWKPSFFLDSLDDKD